MSRTLCLLMALLSTPVLADDEDEEDTVGFGITPWFHAGFSWVNYGEDPEGAERTGRSIEFNVQPLLVFPGAVFGVGLSTGYIGTGGSTAADPKAHVDLIGFQVLPLLMFNVADLFSFHAKAGYVFADFNSADIPAGAVRFGGGITAVIFSIFSAQLALALDVMHTRLIAIEGATTVPDYSVTALQLGITVSYNIEAVD